MKHGQKKEHQWVKAHLCAGVKDSIFPAVAVTDSNSGDSPKFGAMVKKTSEGFTINEVSADMAYSSHINLQLVANECGKAYIPFKKNATGKTKVQPFGARCIIISSLTAMISWSITIRGAISRQPTLPSNANLVKLLSPRIQPPKSKNY
jgi:hypothetical protein